MASRFDLHTHGTRTGEGAWRVELTDAWNIGPVPNGGYQLATMCRAALVELGRPDLVNVSCYFLSASAPGEALLDVEIVKRGRSTSLAQVRLVQGPRERARALVLAGDLDSFAGPSLDLAPPPTMPDPDRCLRIGAPMLAAATLMNEIELRLDPETSGFMRGETGGAPELRAWVRFADGRQSDVLALAMFADVLPPTLFNTLGLLPWVPTLELTAQVRRRPAPGWIRLRVVTRHVSAGHFEEDCEMWDEAGELVAISRQRAMLLPGQR